ncbi:Uu.00g080710.m01.CDS01 [Anthostomella pinea]|uniref:Uu.00g080710.m01.CDS01 n=1 Tax=Anthostomella pinea TaxID=933095 RepID=A0AAI8YJC2_9PEZI|nr:Uu.00g080710.m01.CDS01 [Anthostomella pinea]
MPLWTCDFESCQKSAVPGLGGLGECVLCDRHLCANHLQPEFHSCPRWEDADAYDPAAGTAVKRELTLLFEKINIRALEARASHLRRGTPCSIPPLRYDRATRSSVMGGMNYHFDVPFEDGVTWIARIRRFNATSPSAALRDYIIQSEVATLKFLEQTSVPAPKVHDFDLEGPDNPVGVGFLLLEKLPGKALSWGLANQQQRKTVMSEVVGIFIELHKYPFPRLGSLDSPGDRHNARHGALLREEYHVSSLRLILDLIIRKEMYSQQSVDAYLIHRFLLDLAPLVLPPSSVPDDGLFYLKHADDKGDHIMIDENYHVTGIIDWEWAHTAPAALAFKSPIGFLPVGDFYDGKNDLGDDEVVFARLLEEKGRRGLAQCVWNGRLQHRFAFCCGYDLSGWDGFLGLFRGLREAVKVDAGLEWDEWKAVALDRYRDDAGLKLIASTT